MDSSSMTDTTVRKVANLARLELSAEEMARYAGQLGKILRYVETLSSVPTEDVEPVAQVTGLENVLQADQPAAETIARADFLTQAPAVQDPYLKVKAVLE